MEPDKLEVILVKKEENRYLIYDFRFTIYDLGFGIYDF
jgi:hypothetical protein